MLEDTEAARINIILRNATIELTLKYLSNFCVSLEMPLIALKVEFKIKLPSNCVFSASGADYKI